MDSTLNDSSSSIEKRSRPDSADPLTTTASSTSSSSNNHEDVPRIKKIRTLTSDSVVPRSIDRNDQRQPSLLPIISSSRNIGQSNSRSDNSLSPTANSSPSVFPDTRRIARNEPQLSVLPITPSCSSSSNDNSSRGTIQERHRSDGSRTQSRRPTPGQQHHRQEHAASPRRPAKMTRDQYRSRPPPQVASGTRGSPLYIQKRRSTQAPPPPQSVASSSVR